MEFITWSILSNLLNARRDDALELAKKTRMRLSAGTIELSNTLQDCKTVCRYLGISGSHEWIDFELNGYSTEHLAGFEQIKKFIPEYRHVNQVFYGEYDQPLIGDSAFNNILGRMPLNHPIHEIMQFKEKWVTIRSSTVLDLLNKRDVQEKYLSAPERIAYAKVSPNQIAKIIGGINNRIYEFLDNLILELEYGQIPKTIFENIREEVDSKFMQLCPNAIEKLPVIYEQLGSENKVVYSQIAGTCRQIIKDVADSLYPASRSRIDEVRGSVRLDDSKSINRILESIKSKSEKSVFKSMFEYTDNFLHSLQKYSSKGDHSDFQKSDAIRCVMYTYILLGDILHYYPNKP